MVRHDGALHLIHEGNKPIHRNLFSRAVVRMPVGLGDSLWYGDGHGMFVILVQVPHDSEAPVDRDVFGPLQEVRRFV